MLTFGTSYILAPEVAAAVVAVEQASKTFGWTAETVLLGPAEYFELRRDEHRLLACLAWNPFGKLMLCVYADRSVYEHARSLFSAIEAAVELRVLTHSFDGGLNYRSEWLWFHPDQARPNEWLVTTWREQKAEEQRQASVMLLQWADLQQVDLVEATITDRERPPERDVIVDPQVGDMQFFRDRIADLHGIHTTLIREPGESTINFIERVHATANRANNYVERNMRERAEQRAKLDALRDQRQREARRSYLVST